MLLEVALSAVLVCILQGRVGEEFVRFIDRTRMEEDDVHVIRLAEEEGGRLVSERERERVLEAIPTCNHADDATGNGPDGVGPAPKDDIGDGNDSAADDAAHGQVHPAEGHSSLVQDDGKDTHEDTEAQHADAGNEQDLLARGLGVEVVAVDVIGDQRRHGNQLC